MSHYGVPILRVPETQLSPHKMACSLSKLSSYVKKLKRPLAVDLFCGAGGLSLGLKEAGFDVILGVDSYDYAIASHRANFAGASICADLSSESVVRAIGKALESLPIALIAGGPPCQPFSRAGKNKIRSLKKANPDSRRDLWHSFVTLVNRVKPRAVLIENVPDLAYGENSIVFRKIVRALESMHYTVHARILATWQFGVPQHRQRLIIVGILDQVKFKWPHRKSECRTVRDAISDLPAVDGGARQVKLDYTGTKNAYQRWCRRGLRGKERRSIYDHLTRAVRDDDLQAFRLMNDGTLYSDLPEHLRRYRSDIFEDKYKRLPWDGLSRSITAHIGKDGYWYIHPEQHRTLTIREAARLQTFPDRFRFAGTPSHAFRQIGEAVPPLLALALGTQILSALKSADRGPIGASTLLVARILERFAPHDDSAVVVRQSYNVWQNVLRKMLFCGVHRRQVEPLWRLCNTTWSTPRCFLSDANRVKLLSLNGLQHKNRLLTTLAKYLVKSRLDNTDEKVSIPTGGASTRHSDVVCAIAGIRPRRPVTSAASRVVERIFGEDVHGSSTFAELLIGRAVGVDESGRAYTALLEVGERFCRNVETNCDPCWLAHVCHYAKRTQSKADWDAVRS